MGHGSVHTNCWAALSLPQYSRHVHENSKSRGVLLLALSLVRPGAQKAQCPLILHMAVISTGTGKLLIRKRGVP